MLFVSVGTVGVSHAFMRYRSGRGGFGAVSGHLGELDFAPGLAEWGGSIQVAHGLHITVSVMRSCVITPDVAVSGPRVGGLASQTSRRAADG